MTICIMCNKPLKIICNEDKAVCICYPCIIKQNEKRKNRFKVFS